VSRRKAPLQESCQILYGFDLLIEGRAFRGALVNNVPGAISPKPHDRLTAFRPGRTGFKTHPSAILTLHLYITSFRMEEVVFELVSALSNVGLSVGFIGAASPIAIKWIFIILMWLGRLEIVPVLILTLGLLKGLEDDSRSLTPPDPDFQIR